MGPSPGAQRICAVFFKRKAIFRPLILVVVSIRDRVGIRITVSIVLMGSGFGWRTENSACRVYPCRMENNTERSYMSMSHHVRFIVICTVSHIGSLYRSEA